MEDEARISDRGLNSAKKTFQDSPVLGSRVNDRCISTQRTGTPSSQNNNKFPTPIVHEEKQLVDYVGRDEDTGVTRVTNSIPVYDVTPGAEIEVSHYPIQQTAMPPSSNPIKNYQHVPVVQELQPNTPNAIPGCQCACHHTHHHHHHHTIFINGQPTTRSPVCTALATSNVRDSPRLNVLKTASCPAWADGAPKQNRPILSRTLNKGEQNQFGAIKDLKTIHAAEVRGNFNRNNSTGDGNCPNNMLESDHQIKQPHNYRYQAPVNTKRRCCATLSKGMMALLMVLFLVIISLLSGLIYFLVQGNVPTTQETDVPKVTTVLNQTSICGKYPTEYLSIATRTLMNKYRPSNQHPPKNDNRINVTQAARIIGGMAANIVQYPWQASLWVELRGMTCGGSIILRDWVLTAAHCTESNSDPRLWTAYMGMSMISKKMEPPAQSSKIIKIIQNDQYMNNWSYDYDISLMKLESPVSFTPTVQPICIPHSTDEFRDGTKCYISGWGATSNSGQANAPTTLQHAQISIIGDATCRQDDWLGILVTDRMMCAGTSDGSRDACQGDSGGPLSCYDTTRKAWTLAGSVSWGIECGQPKQPGVYTKMTFFVDWIWTEIGKSEGLIEDTDPVSSGDYEGSTS